MMTTTQLTLRSKRLNLSPFTHDDLELVTELFGNPEVRKYAGYVMSEDVVPLSMPSWIKRGADGVLGIWSIEELRSGRKIGTAALLPMPIDESDTDFDLVSPGSFPAADIEVGYHLLPDIWGNGYATEACSRVVRFAFEKSYLTHIVATFHPDNVASGNVLKKSGFKDLGYRRSYGEEGPYFRVNKADWLNQPDATAGDGFTP